MPSYRLDQPKVCTACGHPERQHSFYAEHLGRCFHQIPFQAPCSCTSYVEQPQPGQEATREP